ncbi:MAG: hypothetical protein LBC77_05765 [Spirochaetaceae bacterium]|jgi:hypothetical protein|nr:hypothetical protein [Spirochaetaceae bacterium]
MSRLLIVCFAAVIFLSCASRRGEVHHTAYESAPYVPYAPRFSRSNISVLDYQQKQEGRALPRWVGAWLSGGEKALERLSAYSGKYCFIMEQTAPSQEVLLRWMLGFQVERNFPTMAQSRVFRCWTEGLGAAPDLLYGSYFEKLLRACRSASWRGAMTDGVFWLLVRQNNSAAADSDAGYEASDMEREGGVYCAIVLVVIDKNVFQNELNAIFNSIVFDKNDSRAQTTAVSEAIDGFWTRF